MKNIISYYYYVLCIFSRTTRVSRYQNITILHFIEARMMEVVATPGDVRCAKL